MISNFEEAFADLKIALILGSTLQSNLVSYRILQTSEYIGKYSIQLVQKHISEYL